MFKKYWLLFLIAGIVLIWISYYQYLFYKYVDTSFITFTGIKNFQSKAEKHEDYYCYIEALISKEDKQKILNRYKFSPLPIKWNGNVISEYYPKNENNYLYYLDDKGHGQYAYVLYFVSKTTNTLIVYQNFGD
jgi:hypothetical protein